MSFITKNANTVLLFLLVISSLALIGATIFFQLNFDRINTEYNYKVQQLRQVNTDLQSQQELLDKIQETIELGGDQILLQGGLLNEQQLEAAQQARTNGSRLDQLAVQMGFAKEEQVLRALGSDPPPQPCRERFALPRDRDDDGFRFPTRAQVMGIRAGRVRPVRRAPLHQRRAEYRVERGARVRCHIGRKLFGGA